MQAINWKPNEVIAELTTMACKGNAKALLIEGKGGISKTHTVMSTIKSLLRDEDCAYINSFSTPLELYKLLYFNKDKKIIVLDDISGLLNNEKNLALLKAALEGYGGVRTVRYLSSTSKLDDVPQEFTITASVIICTNEVPKTPHAKAVATRCKYLKVHYTTEQMKETISEIAEKVAYKGISAKDKKLVSDWLCGLVSPAYTINIRTLYDCFDCFANDKDNWQETAFLLIERDPVMHAYFTAIATSKTIEKQCAAFMRATGLSRSTFYRVKAEVSE